MSAESDYFQSIPLPEFEYQRSATDNRIKRLDILHEAGLIVEAYSTNRTMSRRGEAVHFMAEISHIQTPSTYLGVIAVELTIYSRTDLSPHPTITDRPVHVYTIPNSDPNGVTEWVLAGNYPFRTGQFGALRAGFFSYWGDEDASLVDEYPKTPPETQL